MSMLEREQVELKPVRTLMMEADFLTKRLTLAELKRGVDVFGMFYE